MRIHTCFLLALAAPAAAQPVTRTAECEVTIARAPDEVREAIEAWVRAEPRCATTLDVRVVPTDGGFYLFARDASGRVRERVVPDAQSAGVLVASWVADDLIEALPPVPEIPAEPSAPGATAPVVAPITTTPVLAPAGVAAVAAAKPRRERWLTIGGILQMGGPIQVHGEGGRGLRADLDLRPVGNWSLGAVLAVSASQLGLQGFVGGDLMYGTIDIVDVRALGRLSRQWTSRGGRWGVSFAAAGGLMATRADARLGPEGFGDAIYGVTPMAEASLLLSRRFGDGWAVTLGPTAVYHPQTFGIYDSDGSMTTVTRKDVEIYAFAGIRFRL